MRFLAIGSVLLAWVLAALDYAGPGEKKKPQVSYGLITGTVFRDSGLSLPGAEVTVAPEGLLGKAEKRKKISVVTDSRGEFAVRLPAAPMRYRVSVKAAGYQPQQKVVSTAGEDRVDVFFRLEATSK